MHGLSYSELVNTSSPQFLTILYEVPLKTEQHSDWRSAVNVPKLHSEKVRSTVLSHGDLTAILYSPMS